MSANKRIDIICGFAALLAMIIAFVYMNGGALGIQVTTGSLGYEKRLFDTSSVHTLNIEAENWESFIESCENEEYTACSVTIDGESYNNVGLRAKGNTSLRNVSQMGSDRYSFKIEFDKYDSSNTYYGLDKLCLNNIIQDNTYMKDYLTYRMMGSFGVSSPLCSYVYITVNGEDWGLYLAVEGIEDSFLERNYGKDHGELYKPDSTSFGGGRGNGEGFDIEKFRRDDGVANTEAMPGMPEGFDPSNMPEPPEMPGTNQTDAATDNYAVQSGVVTDMGGAQPGMPEDAVNGNGQNRMKGDGPGGEFSFGAGSSDVKLQYTDDDIDSYSNIFDNAKTDVSKPDKERLISSLKSLSGYEDLENVLHIDEVLRYFVVHNFVVNGDSYTGNMIHNYYLYEKDGRLSMLPWDYNLAYGTFMGGNASSSVNDPIDDVLNDRPMQAWIFSDEEYTHRYHELYEEFLNLTDTTAIIEATRRLIAPYVEKDPSKFCTYEEFEAGVKALESFCDLRKESVKGQLDGTIPSTSEAQESNTEALADVGELNLVEMGSMGGDGKDGGPGMPGGGMPNAQKTGADVNMPHAEQNADAKQSDAGNGEAPSRNEGFPGMELMDEGREALSGGIRNIVVLLAASLLVLGGGCVFAWKYRR